MFEYCQAIVQRRRNSSEECVWHSWMLRVSRTNGGNGILLETGVVEFRTGRQPPRFFVIFHPGRQHRQPHPPPWTHPGVTSDPRVQHDPAGSQQPRSPPFRTMPNSSTNRADRHSRPTRMSPFKMRSMVTGRTPLTRTHPGLGRCPQRITTCTMWKARVLNTTRQRSPERRVSCGQTGRRSTPTIDSSTTATTLLRWRRSMEGE